MKAKSLLPILFFIPLLVSAAEVCQTSDSSCEYYECIESKVHCGEEGYPLRFGKKNCQKYLDQQSQSYEHVQVWYPKIRKCLQDAVDKMLQSPTGPSTCSELESAAFESHIGCYYNTGFCELNFMDKVQVINQTGADFFMYDSIATGIKIENECSAIYKEKILGLGIWPH